MKLIVPDKLENGKNGVRLNRFVEFILYIISYTIAFLLLESIFDSFQIADDSVRLYSLLSVCVIYILNQAVKPILITLTMPLTGLTFGLFYFVINVLILKFTDWIMGAKLNFTDIWTLFFISILLSLIDFIIEDVIVKPLIKKVKKK